MSLHVQNLSNKTNQIMGTEGLIRDISNIISLQEDLKKSRDEIALKLEQTIALIAKMGETRDPYTAGHQSRVTKLACAIAEELEVP